MQKALLFFIFLANSLIAMGQVHVLKDGDSTYLDRVIFENNDTTNIWHFKDNLPKGEYWVINQTACGPDTLQYARFISDGVKHGTWIEWNGGLCVGRLEENSQEVEVWNFMSGLNKSSETVYDSGFIVKSSFYHINSDQPNWELLYPPRTTKANKWTEERVWTESGVLRWTTKPNGKGIDQHTDYYEKGSIKSLGEFDKNGSFSGIWKYYYENGDLQASGKFIALHRKQLSRYSGWRVPKGLWQYWDEQGDLIAKVTFKKGKPKKIKRYQNKEIPFVTVNEMVFKL